MLDYSFKIYCNLYEYENFYGVSSNSPDFNVANVTWTVTPADIKWNKAPEGAYVTSTVDCTITASYVYNGKTYTDSMKQTVDQVKYTFHLTYSNTYVDGSKVCIVYKIDTNIPNFTADNVIWSVGPTTIGWIDGAQYVVDQSSMTLGTIYTLTATYFYNGIYYTDDMRVTLTNDPDNVVTW